MKSALKTPGQPRDERRRRDQELCFHEIEVLEFPQILGDNPFCEGAPLQLAWRPTSTTVLDVDYYEYNRSPRRSSKKKYRIPAAQREMFLLSRGYQMEEIAEACERGLKTRKQRLRSFENKKKWYQLV